MASYFKLQAYGDYTYGSDITALSESPGMRSMAAETPGRDGEYVPEKSYRDPVRISAKGTVRAATFELLQPLLDGFRAAHLHGQIQPLYMVNGTRFYYATVEDISDIEHQKTPFFRWSVSFKASNPFLYSTLLSNANLGAGGGSALAAGTAPAAPTLFLGISSAGSQAAPLGYVNVLNTTTSELFVLRPSATGTYEIETRRSRVMRSGAEMLNDADGRFLHLAPGLNNISITSGNGASVASASLQWRDRWH